MSGFEITSEELAAWADGEVTGARGDAIAAAVAADPALQAQVNAHRALGDKLAAHFAPIAQEPVPDRLAALLRAEPTAANDQIETPAGSADVVNFEQAREKIAAKPKLPRWGWVVGPALAASLALAVFIPRGGDQPHADGYADTQLAAVLDTQLVAEQGDAQTRILLSFQNEGGEFCRAFSGAETGGIACRDDEGWRMEALGEGAAPDAGEYRMAGAPEILAAAQDMAAGEALDAEAEEAARQAGWR